MEKPLCTFKCVLLLFVILSIPALSYSQSEEPTLEQPAIFPTSGPIDGTYLHFDISNPNEGSTVEFYRTEGNTGTWTQIFIERGEYHYTDGPLQPRTEYGYRIRSVKDGSASEYSDVMWLTTESDYYDPFFSAELRSDNYVELRLTDRTFQDEGYVIYRHILGDEPPGESVGIASESDSGLTKVFIDASVVRNTTYVYWVEAAVKTEGGLSFINTASDTVTIPNTLAPPSFTPLFDQQVHQNNIKLVIHNPNAGTSTELYRSTNQEGPFALIHTETSDGEFEYIDEDLKPRTTFYYRARAVINDEYSEYSDVFDATTMSRFYTPFLEASYQPDGSVQVTFQDLSYHDSYYSLYRVNEDGSEEMAIETDLVLTDSGQTKVYVDYPNPGGIYIYYANAEIRDEGFPYVYNVVSDTVDTTDPELTVPEFSYPDEPACGRSVSFGVRNETTGAFTEIYRSMDRNGEFSHYYTLSPGETGFEDSNLRSQTTYYYTLRSEMDGRVSAFSDTIGLMTGSDFYDPMINAMLQDDGTINVEFTDLSYADGSYEIYKTTEDEEGQQQTSFFMEVIMQDSGSMETYVDENVPTEGKVIYVVNARMICEGYPVIPNVARDTVHLSNDNELVTPYFDFSHAPASMPCGNEIAFNAQNPNTSGSMQIWRSMNADNGYQLISTESSQYVSYFDDNLKSRGVYYYKLRAVDGDQMSAFSDPEPLQAGATWYPPSLDATWTDGMIEIKFTDNSYLDLQYELYGMEEGNPNPVILESPTSLDSGAVFTYQQENVTEGKTYRYYVNVWHDCDGQPYFSNVAMDSVTAGESNQLVPPSFDFSHAPANMPCGNQIAFNISNPNQGSTTEIWRSEQEENGYQLLTISEQYGSYLDENLKSRGVYYYKLRAVDGDETSPFSAPQMMQAGATWFNPVIDATQSGDNTVDVALHDNSYLDIVYEFYAVEEGTTDALFTQSVNMVDSGSVHHYSHMGVEPGKTYIYYVNANLDCDGQPYVTNIAMDTLTIEEGGTADGPEVFEFVLVDPYTDEDVRVMTSMDEGFDASMRYNIRVTANDKTQSVAFYINGSRFWGENQTPYALFGDRNGDYHPGRFKPGTYTLTATAFSDNLQKGVTGNSITTEFTVYGDANGSDDQIAANAYPNPAVDHTEIEISGSPNERLVLQIIDARGNAIKNLTDVSGDDGMFFQRLDVSELKKGLYLLRVKMKDKETTTRLLVE